MLKRLTEVVITCRHKTRMPSYPQIAVYFFKKDFKGKGLPYNTWTTAEILGGAHG